MFNSNSAVLKNVLFVLIINMIYIDHGVSTYIMIKKNNKKLTKLNYLE